MGFFTQAAEKFAGFATKATTKAVAKTASEEVFIGATKEGVQFFRQSNEDFSAIIARKESKKIGQLKYKEFGKGYTVTGIYGEIKGVGTQLRMQLASMAKAEGREFLISDIYGSMSVDEMSSWSRLKQAGLDVKEVQVPLSELGLQREGTKFAYKLSLQDELAKTNIQFQKNAITAQQVMDSGAGNDATTLLNRSINHVRGSHKMSAAL